MDRQFTSRTAHELQRLKPSGWEFKDCKTRLTPRASRTSHSVQWRLTRIGDAPDESRPRRRFAPQRPTHQRSKDDTSRPPPCPIEAPGVPNGLGNWKASPGPISLDVRQRMAIGCVVVMFVESAVEDLWELNEEPPWVWSPVSEPPGCYAALVTHMQGENIKIQMMCEDPEEPDIWIENTSLKPASVSARNIWDVRSKLRAIPPSGMQRRWLCEGDFINVHRAPAAAPAPTAPTASAAPTAPVGVAFAPPSDPLSSVQKSDEREDSVRSDQT